MLSMSNGQRQPTDDPLYSRAEEEFFRFPELVRFEQVSVSNPLNLMSTRVLSIYPYSFSFILLQFLLFQFLSTFFLKFQEFSFGREDPLKLKVISLGFSKIQQSQESHRKFVVNFNRQLPVLCNTMLAQDYRIFNGMNSSAWRPSLAFFNYRPE